MKLATALRRPRTWLIAIPVLLVLGLVAGPYVYIHYIKEDAPARFALTDNTTPATTGATGSTANGSIEGTWTVTTGSQAGYRIKEVLFGQDAEAAGRTTDVTGELVIVGASVESASFTVDLTTVESDEDRRDRQFQGRIMDTATYPEATFELSEPITLASVPGDGEQITQSATGTFTIHGVTKTVTFDLAAQRNGSTLELTGSIPVVLADYDIPDPSFGPASVQDRGEIEFFLVLSPASAS